MGRGTLRRLVARLLAAGLAFLGAATDAGGGATGTTPSVLFTLQDERINESSGFVAASRRDGVYFTHNDSGDGPRFFALDSAGCTTAVYNLAGVDVAAFKAGHDVEDMAGGPHDGRPSLWLADIGDNAHARLEGVDVYRVDEPVPPASNGGSPCPSAPEVTVATTRYHLVYPDSPHDAETLLADPATGRLYIVTKTPLGQSSVYAAPLPLAADRDNPLSLVAAFVFPPSTTMAGETGLSEQLLFDLAGRFAATGGDIAPDGSKVAVRTYTDVWEWDVTAGDIAGAFRGTPRQIPLPYARQGEALSYTRDSAAILTSCEDVGCPVHRIGS